ncbi:MAG TPA: cyclopropane-fatty-acyl-phospholipid synthase family protein [Phycisphaerales bacterium]|nr:cyclopropane-fatty-acyl-phospholipid synthase family protein [Phycisphaerales bacterium]
MERAATMMKESVESVQGARVGLTDRVLRKALIQRLELIRSGRIIMHEPGGTVTTFGPQDAALRAEIGVRDGRFYRACTLGGTVGTAEAYIEGWWTCDRLTDLIRVFALDRETLRTLDGGISRVLSPVNRFLHWLSRNTREGSRKNIAAHYDLGNDFFSLFLDPTMMYSCAFFERPGMSLEEASFAKLDRLCRKLALSPEDHLVEIGTGWGGLAIHAASRYGCRVTTTTISREQARFARDRIASRGLADRITVLEKDYRDLEGSYDKLVSIEMIEAVGHQYLPAYLAKCASLLKPEGVMAIQAITMQDRDYHAALRQVDFIQKYIFPGSFIPSLGAIQGAMAAGTDLRVVHIEDIGHHYVRTLACWRESFMARLDAVRALGFDDAFIRMWDYYFCYCEGAFAERHIGDAQIVMARSRARPGTLSV